MKVYEAFAELFAREGVTDVFGLMGDGNMHWWASLLACGGVRVHATRHEGPSVSMAEGWARATGEPGVATVTMGPGLAQTSLALLVASRGHVPLVVFAGEVAHGAYGASQYLDQSLYARATEAAFVSGAMAGGPARAVQLAFHRARTESRPVILSVPLDFQLTEFGGDLDGYRPSSTLIPPRQRIRPDPERVAEAVDMLRASRAPVVLVGRGAIRSGAGDAVRRLADRVGALIVTSMPAKGYLADDSFHAGISGGFTRPDIVPLVDRADCVLAVGASVNPYTLNRGRLYRDARFIQVDTRPQIVLGTGRIADCYVQGDAHVVVEEIDRRLAEASHSSPGYRTPGVAEVLACAARDDREFPIPDGTVDPRRAAEALDRALPLDVGLFIGQGRQWAWPIFYMAGERHPTFFTGGFGSVGMALPTAIGVAAAIHPRPLVMFEGDCGFLMQIQELDTAARLGLRMLAVVNNDAALGVEYEKLRAAGFDPMASTAPSPDFATVARGFGCGGATITSVDEIAARVDEWLAGSGPMLLDVRIPPTVVRRS